jgi:hypothetical protein
MVLKHTPLLYFVSLCMVLMNYMKHTSNFTVIHLDTLRLSCIRLVSSRTESRTVGFGTASVRSRRAIFGFANDDVVVVDVDARDGEGIRW